MLPVNSNHGGKLTDLDTSTVENKGFHMVPLLYYYCIGEIYMIRLKFVYLYHFRPYYVNSGDRVQTALDRSSSFLDTIIIIFTCDIRLVGRFVSVKVNSLHSSYIPSTPRMWGPNMDPINYANGHFLYKYEAMQTVWLG